MVHGSSLPVAPVSVFTSCQLSEEEEGAWSASGVGRCGVHAAVSFSQRAWSHPLFQLPPLRETGCSDQSVFCCAMACHPVFHEAIPATGLLQSGWLGQP